MSSNFSLETFSLVSFVDFTILFRAALYRSSNRNQCFFVCARYAMLLQLKSIPISSIERDEWRTKLNNKIFVFLSRQSEEKKGSSELRILSIPQCSFDWMIDFSFRIWCCVALFSSSGWQWNENLMHNTHSLRRPLKANFVKNMRCSSWNKN